MTLHPRLYSCGLGNLDKSMKQAGRGSSQPAVSAVRRGTGQVDGGRLGSEVKASW